MQTRLFLYYNFHILNLHILRVALRHTYKPCSLMFALANMCHMAYNNNIVSNISTEAYVDEKLEVNEKLEVFCGASIIVANKNGYLKGTFIIDEVTSQKGGAIVTAHDQHARFTFSFDGSGKRIKTERVRISPIICDIKTEDAEGKIVWFYVTKTPKGIYIKSRNEVGRRPIKSVRVFGTLQRAALDNTMIGYAKAHGYSQIIQKIDPVASAKKE